MTYQHFTAMLLLMYGNLFLSGIYYCLRVFWCATVRMSELELGQRTFSKEPLKSMKCFKKAFFFVSIMSRTKTLEWYSGFKTCESLVEGFERAGRPLSRQIDENVEKKREIIHEDERLAVNNVGNIVHVAYGTCARV